MSSTLKDNSARATIYMAFPQKRRAPGAASQGSVEVETGLGGLLDGVGPTLSDLSIWNLLRGLKS